MEGSAGTNRHRGTVGISGGPDSILGVTDMSSTITSTAPRGGTAGGTTSPRAVVMLVVATVGFAVNFWAWALLSPLAPKFKEILALSPLQQALVVAVPVVVG